MTTTEKLNLFKDSYLKWLTACRDHPGLYHPEPKPEDVGLTTLQEDWAAQQVKGEITKEFERKV